MKKKLIFHMKNVVEIGHFRKFFFFKKSIKPSLEKFNISGNKN